MILSLRFPILFSEENKALTHDIFGKLTSLLITTILIYNLFLTCDNFIMFSQKLIKGKDVL